jgi:hypothetical protein
MQTHCLGILRFYFLGFPLLIVSRSKFILGDKYLAASAGKLEVASGGFFSVGRLPRLEGATSDVSDTEK